jgi:hypothetical protein
MLIKCLWESVSGQYKPRRHLCLHSTVYWRSLKLEEAVLCFGSVQRTFLSTTGLTSSYFLIQIMCSRCALIWLCIHFILTLPYQLPRPSSPPPSAFRHKHTHSLFLSYPPFLLPTKQGHSLRSPLDCPPSTPVMLQSL